MDVDGDGRRAPSEPVATGALVTLVLADGTRRTVVTDLEGRYELVDVPVGLLTIEVLSDGLTRRWTAEVLRTTVRLDVPFAVEPMALALTGRPTGPDVALALLLLGLGSALLFAGHRSRRVSAAE